MRFLACFCRMEIGRRWLRRKQAHVASAEWLSTENLYGPYSAFEKRNNYKHRWGYQHIKKKGERRVILKQKQLVCW